MLAIERMNPNADRMSRFRMEMDLDVKENPSKLTIDLVFKYAKRAFQTIDPELKKIRQYGNHQNQENTYRARDLIDVALDRD